MRNVLPVIAVVLGFTAAGFADPITGWRNDGRGVYPDATPPTEWSRTPDSVLAKLRTTATRPNDDKLIADRLSHHMIMNWLTIGPFDADKEVLGHAYIPDEAAVSPTVGDKIGDQSWAAFQTKLNLRDANHPVNLDNAGFGGLMADKKGGVLYAHAYLLADRPGKIVAVVDHFAAIKMYFNAQAVYENPKSNCSLWAQNNISWGWSVWKHLPFEVAAKRVTLDVKQGLNRLLIKTTGDIHLRFTAEPGVKYNDKNIVWATQLPDYSPSSPIIVGERIFTTSDPDELICVDKTSGRILWRRSNNFFDATPEADRKANAAFEKLAPISAKIAGDVGPEEKLSLRKQLYDGLVAIDKDRYEMKIEGHPMSHRPCAGWTAPTPCSDGKFVYFWGTNGVAACYDLEGTRRWLVRVDLLLRNAEEKYGPYSYPTSPALIDNKFVMSVPSHGTVALNAADGSTAWVNRDMKMTTQLSVGTVRTKGVVFANNGTVVNAKDGKVLWDPKNQYGSPSVFDKGILYFMPLEYRAFDFSAAGEDFAPKQQFYEGQRVDGLGAPLIHDGLFYMAGVTGELRVCDTKTSTLVYRQQLDLDPVLHYNAAGVTCSPTLAGKYVYVFDNQGNAVVFEAGREFKQVARNKIETLIERPFPTDPQEVTAYSNPVFEGSRMYVRGERFLYCIGK